MAQKDNLLIIAPTKIMARYVCTEIFGINPNEYSYDCKSSLAQLKGRYEPTIIIYCIGEDSLWKSYELDELLNLVKTIRATVLYLPEVRRVIREEKLSG